MFQYCGNNPVMNHDPDGHCWHRAWITDCDKCKASNKNTVSLTGIFNAMVNNAASNVAAQTGNPALANQIANQIKIGDKRTTSVTQAAVNFVANNTFVVDATVGVDASIIPIVNKIPIIKDIGSINVGMSQTLSAKRETSTFIHAGVGIGVGVNIADLPVSFSYSIGILPKYNSPSDMTGWGYGLGVDYLWAGGGAGGWYGSGLDSFSYSASTGVGVSYGWDYTWDIRG